MKQYQANGLRDTQKIAQELARSFKGGEVIGLVGELGSGKTTLVQFLAEALGVKEKVLSPTFVLMKIYNTANTKIRTLVHADAYRLNDSVELKNIGLEEYLGRPATVVVIEWAGKVQDLLPKNSTIIEIKEGEAENERIVEISANSARS